MSIGVVRVQSIRISPAITYRAIEGTYPKIYTRKKDDLEGYERFSRCFSG
jgi:hypothetical protein